MKSKLLFSISILMLMINLAGFSKSEDILNDPRKIIFKPKAKDGFFLFMVKYSSTDLKLLVKKALQTGTADKKFNSLGFSENNIVNQLDRYEGIVDSCNANDLYTYFNGLRNY